MAQLDFPSSPTDGQVYAAPNGANYTWNAAVGVWTGSSAGGALSLSNAGIISGNAQIGQTLDYARGTATGGTPPYTYEWEWRKTSDDSVLQFNGSTYTIPASLLGDNVYIQLTVFDDQSDTDTAVTGNYPAAGVITSSSFPNSAFLPAGAPNASPPEVSTATLHGTATCSNWQDGFTSLTSTGGILFRVNGGSYGTGATSVSDGDTVDLIWDVAVVAAAADGEVLSGTLTDGVYTNYYSMTVTRGVVTGLEGFANLVDQPLSTAVTSDVVTPEGFNVPVTFAFAGSTTPLTSLGVSVSGGAFSASPQTVIPGDTLQLQGTTGGSNSTAYGVDITMGSPAATQTWTATTVALAPAIAQPSITSPANGTADINPAVNSPAGITLTASAYTPLNGAGAQTSSEWEVYEGIPYTTNEAVTSVRNLPRTVLVAPNVALSGSDGIAFSINTPGVNPEVSFSPGISNFNASAVSLGVQFRVGGNWLNLPVGSFVTGARLNLAVINAGGVTGVTSGGVPVDLWTTATVELTVDNTSGWLSNVTVGQILSGSGGQTLTVASVDIAASTITSTAYGFSGTWTTATTISATAPAPTTPPTTVPPDPTKYTAITGSPFTDTSAPFTTIDIPQADLTVSSNYFARVQYATTNSQAATSEWSAWSEFGTASDFSIAPGTAMQGGYFAGQIVGAGGTSGGGLDDLGVIYNIIVAPVQGDTSGPAAGGSLSGANFASSLQYKTTNTGNGVGCPNATNENFGGLCTSEVLSGAALGGVTAYPLFDTFINGATGPNAGAFNLTTGGVNTGTGIGGYNDWYLPAKNELEIAYFNLKPNTTSNNTGSGINPSSVPPRSTNYTAGNPAQTSVTIFQTGGSQAFLVPNTYLVSTVDSGNSGNVWTQQFGSGVQVAYPKIDPRSARAIRRVAA